jgi:large subunit ribosomal protein L21
LDAVVRTGGKQYRVHEGSVLNVATIAAEPGSRIELSDVLLVTDGPDVSIGNPTVDGAIVVADVVEHGKGKKVINFKYKAKVRYRRKRGHRQAYTTLEVREIRVGGKSATAPSRRRIAAAPAEDEPIAAAPEAPTAEVTETPTAETPAATPRRRTRAVPKTDAPATEPEAKAPAPRRRRTASSETESQE